jgi:Tol biopolymer transport system component
MSGEIRFSRAARITALALVALVVAAVPAAFAPRTGAEVGDVLLVSSNSRGVPGDYGSAEPFITPDGRYAAFGSVASNLVSPAPPEEIEQVYRKDLLTGETVLASSSSAGEAGDLNSYPTSISADGRYVLFFSFATNLVSPPQPGFLQQVYRKDLRTGGVALVSTNAAGEAGDGDSFDSAISGDGNRVTFMSVADNLIAASPAVIPQIYLKDLSNGAVSLVSAGPAGEEADGPARFPSISADGRYVVFDTDAGNLGGAPAAGTSNVYRKDTRTGEIVMASTNSAGRGGNAGSDSADISDGGRFVVFNSEATNIVSPPTPAGIRMSYCKDMDTGEAVLVSADSEGVAGNDNSDSVRVSGNGRYATFISWSTNLVSPPYSGDFPLVYRKNIITGQLEPASVSASGEPADDGCGNCSISGEGRYVAFDSLAGNLFSPAPPPYGQTYMKELDVPGADNWYLAEGSTGGGFDTWVLLQNPGPDSAEVDIVFSSDDGPVSAESLTMDPESRATLRLADYLHDTWGVSTLIGSNRPVVAERSMYWDRNLVGESDNPGTPEPFEMRSGHANGGVPGPVAEGAGGSKTVGTTHYFPEGATGGGFDTWILLVNPGEEDAEARVTLMDAGGIAAEEEVTVGGMSRATVRLDDYLPDALEVATRVESDQPLVAERSMYWDPQEGEKEPCQTTGGHSNAGSPESGKNWYLAEGATAAGFDTYILLQNPNDTGATAEVTFINDSGVAGTTSRRLPPNSRSTINVGEHVPDDFHVSTVVNAERPVVAERSMYWDKRAASVPYRMRDGHSTVGVNITSREWLVPEGSTGGGFESFILIANTQDSRADVWLTFMTDEGANDPVKVSVPADSRYTVRISDYLPDTWGVSALVSSGNDLVVERSMYWDNRESSPGGEPEIRPYEMMGGHSAGAVAE